MSIKHRLLVRNVVHYRRCTQTTESFKRYSETHTMESIQRSLNINLYIFFFSSLCISTYMFTCYNIIPHKWHSVNFSVELHVSSQRGEMNTANCGSCLYLDLPGPSPVCVFTNFLWYPLLLQGLCLYLFERMLPFLCLY
jgi:hypothetical protein